MNKKIKKTLKWAGIGIGVASVGVTTYVLIKHPEVSNEIVGGLKKGCKKATSCVVGKETTPESPKREGRNNGGYYKPRYNNKKN
jgi:hypothetical protein